MAICGIGFNSGLETIDLLYSSVNLPKKHLKRRLSYNLEKPSWGIRCSASELKENVQSVDSDLLSIKEEDLGHVLKSSRCLILSLGSVGGGTSWFSKLCPLHNKRVVLRRFTTSTQAQRSGRRSVEVLKKLARRKLLYHSCSMQVHGYVDPSSGIDQNSFTLVHGYHGSYSPRHWLQLSNCLPTLKATLALDEERVRKVGDDTVGGPAVSRLLRIIRVLMRDLLIGVNDLQSWTCPYRVEAGECAHMPIGSSY